MHLPFLLLSLVTFDHLKNQILVTADTVDNYSTDGFSTSRRLLFSIYNNQRKQNKKQILSDQFNEYYRCQKRNTREYLKGVLPIHANLYQETMSVTLKCEICLRPDQNEEELSIHWRRRLVFKKWRQEIVTVDHEKFILSPEKNLIIHGLTIEDSGQYICYKKREHLSVHHVDVVKRERFYKVVENGLPGRKATAPKVLKENNLLVYTSWSEWGQCTQCDGSGQRQRLGTCMVKKVYPQHKVLPHDMPMLQHYPTGVPCRSSLLPPFLADLGVIRERRSETQVGNCREPCPTVPAVKTIRDRDGNVVEVVETGKGVVSMRDGRPTMPPMVKRKTIYQEFWTPLVVSCPHKHSTFAAVRWQNGTNVLNPLLIKRQSRGRVRIDMKNRLRILRLKMFDSNVYSCWINDAHVASIKLRVIETTNTHWSDYVILIGVGLTLLVLFIIGFKIAKLNRSRGKGLK